MWPLLSKSLRKLDLWSFHRSIKGALALQRRGEVRSDGLSVVRVCNLLQISWRARDLHPWDRDLPNCQRKTEFAQQALADTEAAIRRIFERRPEIDVIELRVLEPRTETLIAAGTVSREALDKAQRHLLSVGMRLRELGVRYHFAARARRSAGPNE